MASKNWWWIIILTSSIQSIPSIEKRAVPVFPWLYGRYQSLNIVFWQRVLSSAIRDSFQCDPYFCLIVSVIWYTFQLCWWAGGGERVITVLFVHEWCLSTDRWWSVEKVLKGRWTLIFWSWVNSWICYDSSHRLHTFVYLTLGYSIRIRTWHGIRAWTNPRLMKSDLFCV